jgi:hypothetical protein
LGDRFPPLSFLNHMNTPNFTTLIKDAELAAHSWNEFDIATLSCNEAFGLPFNAAKETLTNNVTIAESRKFDLSVFSGAESAFKFPALETNIVVRVTRKPTAHSKLERIDDKIEQLEQKLKVAKIERKKLIEQLAVTGDVDMITDKINLAFTRLK